MTLIHFHEIMKFRIFTSLNKRKKGTFPKQMTITIRSNTESTVSRLTRILQRRKPFQTPPNKGEPYLCLEHEKNQGSAKSHELQKRTTPKTSSPTKISCNLIAPSIKNSSLEMLKKTRQIAKQRLTRPRPSKSKRIPSQTNLSSTGREKMDRTMPRATLTNHFQRR